MVRPKERPNFAVELVVFIALSGSFWYAIQQMALFDVKNPLSLVVGALAPLLLAFLVAALIAALRRDKTRWCPHCDTRLYLEPPPFPPSGEKGSRPRGR